MIFDAMSPAPSQRLLSKTRTQTEKTQGSLKWDVFGYPCPKLSLSIAHGHCKERLNFKGQLNCRWLIKISIDLKGREERIEVVDGVAKISLDLKCLVESF